MVFTDIWTCSETAGGCGAENPDWHSFCPVCGTYPGNLQTPHPTAQVPVNTFEEQQSREHTKPSVEQPILANAERTILARTTAAPAPREDPTQLQQRNRPSSDVDATVPVCDMAVSRDSLVITSPTTNVVEGFDHQISGSALTEEHEPLPRSTQNESRGIGYEWDQKSKVSDTSDSIFSIESSETSATAISMDSGFTVAQIQNATKAFISILVDDDILAPLYENARNDIKIGPKRLRRHIREAVKIYAENLEEEAGDRLEFAACRLVQTKAGHAARYIASGWDGYNQPEESVNDRSRVPGNLEDSSEEESVERPVRETQFRDLEAFRRFLTESNAYTILRAQIQAFCTKTPTALLSVRPIGELKLPTDATSHSQVLQYVQYPYEESSSNRYYHKGREVGLIPATENSTKLTWRVWQKDAQNLVNGLHLGFDWAFMVKAALLSLIDIVFLLTDDFLIATGHLESPLEVGWTRIRTECSCGDRFFDDYKGLTMGGMGTLVQEMKQPSVNAKIKVIPYRTGIKTQQYTARLSMWLRRIGSSLSAAFSWHDRTPIDLPHFNVGETASVTSTTTIGSSKQHRDPIHLMTCLDRGHNGPVLLQIDVRAITNDQALFSLLRHQIARSRNRLLRALSCRCIQGIYFRKFCLYSRSHVDMRDHDESCLPATSTASHCECLHPVHIVEPFPNAEYRCDIPCPPDTWPPVGSSRLVHMLKCPSTINEKCTRVLYQVPKRVTGELSECDDQPADGWGFYFKDGWDFDIIITISFVILMLASLLFGVCWSVLKKDIQAAFGVSAYMVTVCGLFVALIVGKTGKAG